MARPIEKQIENVSEGLNGYSFPDAPTVHKTTDYKKFKSLKANREINARHVLAMMHSIVNNPGLLAYQPILTTKDLSIVDGQHTFEACKRLGAPVYYMIRKEGTSNDAAILNDTRKSWTLTSWLHHWSSRGMSDYKEMEKFLQKYDMSPSQAAAILEGNKSGKSYNKIAFKRGRFKVSNKEEAYKLAKVLTLLKDTYGKEFAFKYSFVKAFLDCYYNTDDRTDEFELDEFTSQLKRASDKLMPAADASMYVRQIESVCNFHRQNKKRFI